jgi:hypothetical protein
MVSNTVTAVLESHTFVATVKESNTKVVAATNSLQKLVSLENFPTTSSQQDSAGPHADTVTRDAVFSSTPAFFLGIKFKQRKQKCL